jgi:hypothetical protein
VFRLQSGGSEIHDPITAERIRIQHDPKISNKNVINLVMQRYPEPDKTDAAADLPPEPGPELMVDTPGQEPAIDVPTPTIPQPSYPITLPFQNQQSVLSLTKRDHDDIVASVNQGIRQQVAAAMPGARLAGAPHPPPDDLGLGTIDELKAILSELVQRNQLPIPLVLTQRRNPSKRDLIAEIHRVGGQFGYGSRSDSGTSTSDLGELCERIGLRHIRVIASDEVHTLKLDERGRLAFIMNLDPSTERGSHWVAVNVCANHQKHLEYYDSLGNSPSRDFLTQIKKVVGDSKSLLKLKTNRIPDQSVTSSNCGYFAVKFLRDRITNGQSFAQASGYWSDAKTGERRIEKFKKEYI